MIKTTRGLPNSCSQCGNRIEEGYWYAANEDAAFAGQGICEKDFSALENEERLKNEADKTTPPAIEGANDETTPDAPPVIEGANDETTPDAPPVIEGEQDGAKG